MKYRRSDSKDAGLALCRPVVSRKSNLNISALLTICVFALFAMLLPSGWSQTAILMNVNSSTYPTACTVANFQALGIPGLSAATTISQYSPVFNSALTSPMTFTNGGFNVHLSTTANAGTYVKPAGAGATNGLMDCYFWISTATPTTITISNLNLTPGTNYTLYVIGTLPSVGNNEDGTFQPVNTANITFGSTSSAQGFLIATFTTSASLASTDTLSFNWSKSPTFNGSFQGLAIVPGVPPTPTQTFAITNGTQRYATLTNATVTMTGKCELWLTNALVPFSGCVINLNSSDAWLFLPNIKPSIAVLPTYLGQLRINGATAVADSNCRVVQYGQSGCVVIPQSSSFQPLTVYSGAQFNGTATSYRKWTYYTGTAYTNFSSFKLKRGYQAVLAQSANGANFSKCYIAQDGDLEIGMLPSTLDHQVQFIYVTPWRWVPKKGIAGDPGIPQLNVGSWYNWDISSSSSRDTEYAAIEQQPYWPSLSQNWQSRGINTLLGYNEPDNSAQDSYKNLTPPGSYSDAAARLPGLLATGLRLGSPATTDGGRSSWLYPFIAQADSAGYRVDFIAIHYYWCYDPSNPSGAATQMYNFLLDIWNNTHRPIWITEWNNGANWTGCADPTYAQQQSCVSSMINMLETTPFVERYELYNWVEDVRSVTTNGVLTPAGITYRDKVSSLSYSQTMPDNGTRSVAEFLFATNTWDASGNFNNGMAVGAPWYSTGHVSQAQSIVLDGTNSYVQLPANVAKSSAFTFAGWVYWNGGAAWQRIFDFGNDTSHYLFLTPSTGSALRFAINNGSGEQTVTAASALPSGSWQHVAITLSGASATLYLNGVQVASSNNFSIAPSNFSPTRNFLGKSQFTADPLFNGKLDGVEIADYAMTASQISALYNSAPVPIYTGGVWTNTLSDNWSTASNWTNGIVANGAGFVADFSTLNLASDRTVTLDSARTVGGLRFGDTAGSQNWTLAGANTLTLDSGVEAPTISVVQNTATISTLLAGANGFTKTGNGTVVLNSNSVVGGALSVNAGTVNITGASTAIGNGTSYVGYRTGSGALNVLSGNTSVSGELRVGGSDVNGSAYTASGTVTVSNATLGVGALTVARAIYLDNSVAGTVVLNNGGTLISTNDAVLEYAGTGRGKLALNGGSFIVGPTATKWFMVGYYDTGAGELDITNGNVILDNNSSLKMCRSGNTGGNVVNQLGGAMTFYSDAGTTIGGSGNLDLNYAGAATSTNTYNLRGGTVTTPAVIASSATGNSTFNFNGGTLKPAVANATFMQGLTVANVRNSGAIIDSTNHNITIAQPLLHSTVAGDNAADGGLTKLGTATLTLTTTNTYTGVTTINAGTLALSGGGSIASSPKINVGTNAVFDVSAKTGGFVVGAAQTLLGNGSVMGILTNNGTLAPGVTAGTIGALTFNTPPTLTGGTTLVKINRNNGTPLNDQVRVPSGPITYGGVLTISNIGAPLQAGDAFQLFSASGYNGNFTTTNLPALGASLVWTNSLGANGTIAVLSTVSLVPTNITMDVSGSGLTLSWPADHTGWRLQVQTNTLDAGLGTNWFDVAGSTATNSMTIPTDLTAGSVFYRLVYP